MKKRIFIVLLTLLFLVGCTNEPIDDSIDCNTYPNHIDCVEPDDSPVTGVTDYIDIYYINDLHGAILGNDDELGLAQIGNLILTKKAQNPDNVLFLGGGDLLQGSALSNYYTGGSTIELLNLMEMDAMVIGNHEFDWGLDTLLEYRDGSLDNGEADFPFLGANIFYQGTTDIPNLIDPYTIIEKGDKKIGIIGTIGDTLEQSIATRRVEGYEFKNSVELIAYYSNYLRTEEDCDVIISLAHESGDINPNLIGLEGNERVDVIFNAHSHQKSTNLFGGIPQIQSGANGEVVGYVRVNFNEGFISTYETTNLSSRNEPLLLESNALITNQIEVYLAETDVIFNTPIIVSGDYYSTYDLSDWLTKVMAQATLSDIAFHNYGGTRSSISDATTITKSTLYDVWPFDNIIKTVELEGSVINALIASNQLAYYTDHSTFDDTTLYKVATNDYVFDKTTNPFLNGTNIENTGIILRDMVEDELVLQSELYDLFYTTNSILINPLIDQTSYHYKSRYQ
ncbi:MAG: bifunctional metallophosphatase/5'-nucleotidase [Candidatus Izimaplasma sp.]|nr:bifunctional metallophosphatase/5'-nucleotidase [Candidatus Izimaplasma bacterium]